MIRKKYSIAELIKESGKILGPGKPDGTGPMKNTSECPMMNAEDRHPALERIQKIKDGLRIFIDRNESDWSDDPSQALKNFIIELKEFVNNA